MLHLVFDRAPVCRGQCEEANQGGFFERFLLRPSGADFGIHAGRLFVAVACSKIRVRL